MSSWSYKSQKDESKFQNPKKRFSQNLWNFSFKSSLISNKFCDQKTVSHNCLSIRPVNINADEYWEVTQSSLVGK